MKVDELTNSLKVCLDNGGKKEFLPISLAIELEIVPADLIRNFNFIFL